MTTRDATDRDWDAIRALLDRHGLPTAGAREHLAHFIVAEDRAGLAGVGGLEVYGRSALLRSIAAARDGCGIGQVLVEQLMARARALGVTDLVLLTTSAAGYFPRFGFETIARAEVPESLLASREFQGACPSSATVMRRRLVTDM